MPVKTNYDLKIRIFEYGTEEDCLLTRRYDLLELVLIKKILIEITCMQEKLWQEVLEKI